MYADGRSYSCVCWERTHVGGEKCYFGVLGNIVTDKTEAKALNNLNFTFIYMHGSPILGLYVRKYE